MGVFVSAVCSCALLDGRLLLCLLGVCLFVVCFLVFCGCLPVLVFVVCCFLLWRLLAGDVGSVGFCLWVWLVLVAGRVLSGVFLLVRSVVPLCSFLVCSCGWSAVAVLGFVLVVSAVFVCLVNESSAGADADLFVYK